MKKQIEMKEKIYITDYKCFTEVQAEWYLKNKVSGLNYEILVAHLCHPELAMGIEGFSERNGILFLKIGEEMLPVTNSWRN